LENKDSIIIWSESNGAYNDMLERKILPSLNKKLGQSTQISAELIAKNFRNFIKKFQDILGEQDHSNDKFIIENIELNLAINAQGGIELIGKMSANIATSVKVKLVRKED